MPRKPLPCDDWRAGGGGIGGGGGDRSDAAGGGGSGGGGGEVEEEAPGEQESLLAYDGEAVGGSIYSRCTAAGDAAATKPATPKPLGCFAFVRKFVNPPMLASFTGVTLACIAPVREAFLGSVLFDSIQSVGVASPPVMLINLGAQMSLQPKGKRAVPFSLMVSIVVGRLILMPILGSIIVFGSVAAGILPHDDRTLLLLLLIQSATPTAMSLGTISQMHGQHMDEIAEIMFVVNLISVPLSTLAIAGFLAALDPASGFLEMTSGAAAAAAAAAAPGTR